MNYLTLILFTFALLLASASPTPVRAGEPTGEIGPMNPTMFKCVSKEDPRTTIELDIIQNIITNDHTTETSSCTTNFDIVSDFGFDTTDAVEFRGFLKDAERECSEKDGRLEKVADTRIEGIVYEFHPENPLDPQGSDWVGVRSRDVPVVARGITFEIEWGSEKDGTFFFDHMGAGPIVLNLRLPPDAHPLNPNLVVKSTGLQETRTVFLGFYRGDLPEPGMFQLHTEDGRNLPFATDDDIFLANNCGLPMPNVGGILPPEKPTSILALAAAMLVILPTVGFLKLRQNRSVSSDTR